MNDRKWKVSNPRMSCESEHTHYHLGFLWYPHQKNKMAQGVEISQLQIPHLEALRGQLEEVKRINTVPFNILKSGALIDDDNDFRKSKC